MTGTDRNQAGDGLSDNLITVVPSTSLGSVEFMREALAIGIEEGLNSSVTFREPSRRPVAIVGTGIDLLIWPEEGMNWAGWLTALLVMLALAGCAPVVAMPGQAPNAPYQ
jgi:hypothetical protein